jgi:hypothetical protein
VVNRKPAFAKASAGKQETVVGRKTNNGEIGKPTFAKASADRQETCLQKLRRVDRKLELPTYRSVSRPTLWRRDWKPETGNWKQLLVGDQQRGNRSEDQQREDINNQKLETGNWEMSTQAHQSRFTIPIEGLCGCALLCLHDNEKCPNKITGNQKL